MGVDGSFVNGGKRSLKRARVLLTAKLRRQGVEVDVRLRDLSRKGALIEGSGQLEIGEEVVFSRGATVVPARVAWASGERVGLEFLRMIDESELLIHINRMQVTQNQQRFRRPRVLSEDISDHERKLARVWGAAVGICVGD